MRLLLVEHWQKAKFKLQLTCFHEAKIYDYSPTERRIVDMWNAKIMRGTGAQVTKKPITWQECIHSDEPLILSFGHWPQAICHSNRVHRRRLRLA
jgi:hypothetical protein